MNISWSVSKKQLAIMLLLSAVTGAAVGLVCTLVFNFDAWLTGGIAGGLSAVLANAYMQKSSGE